MAALCMIPAFMILTGCAMLIACVLRTGVMEGMFLSVLTVIMTLYFSGRFAGSFRYGFFVLVFLGCAGLAFGLVRAARKRDFMLNRPAFWVLALVLLYGIVLFSGTYLQHIDEFHMWAAAVRYMLLEDHTIVWSEFISGKQFYGASFFQLFFQLFSGYSEQNMYASSALMIWIGFLLPYSGFEKKHWVKVFLYSSIIYAALYSVYTYNYKTLYTDLPCAAWAGGIAGWWMNRDRRRTKKRSNCIVLLSGLTTLIFFKSYVGILMAVFSLMFVLEEWYLNEGGILSPIKKKRAASFAVFLTASAVFLPAFFIILYKKAMLPSSLLSRITWALPSKIKALKILGALANAIVGRSVTGNSERDVYCFFFFFCCLAALWGASVLRNEEWKVFGRSWFIVLSFILYSEFLAFAYFCLFEYEEAIEARGCGRYLSILILWWFLICLSVWIQKKRCLHDRAALGCMLVVLLFFVTGFNADFLSQATSFDDERVSGREEILETSSQVEAIKELTDEDDRIYMLNQDTENEFPQNVALYYMYGQVSNYNREPWRFMKGGCEIRIKEEKSPVLQDFPELLSDGGYDYVWIFRADSYLTETLPEVFAIEYPDNVLEGGGAFVGDGQLYEIVRSEEEGEIMALRLCAQL